MWVCRMKEIILSKEKCVDSVRIPLRWGGRVKIVELSEEKMQLSQQCNKGKTVECGIQRVRYYKKVNKQGYLG